MRKLTIIGVATLLILALAALPTAQTQPYDLLLRNGRIVDGSGSPWYRGDIAIRGDTIVRIAPSITEPAARVIDLGGQVLAPGFIDIHTHARRGIFDVPTADNYIRQGVTTVMEGPDGSSPVPLAPFLARLDALPKSINIGSFIDQYPYTASSTGIQAALFPAWAQEGGREQVLKRLKDPSLRAKIKTESVRLIRNERGGGDPKNVVIARCEWDTSLAGKSLAEVARLRGMDPTIENAAEAALWLVEQGGCQGIFHAISAADLERIHRPPATMIGSDGEIPIFGKANPHP